MKRFFACHEFLSRKYFGFILVMLIFSCIATFADTLIEPILLPHQNIMDAKSIAIKFGPSVVLLQATDNKGEIRRIGSGIFVTSDGIIATNYHVVKGLQQLKVRLNNGEERIATDVIGYSEQLDLIVFRTKGSPTSQVILGNSDQVSPGEAVVAIGNPEGLENSISTGVISAVRAQGSYNKVIQFTAPVSPGSSGGALFNEYGELIGVVTYGFVEGQNLNFAVPVNNLKPIIASGQSIQLKDISGNFEPEKQFSIFNGIWNGIATNYSYGISGNIQISLKIIEKSISGSILISKPLSGSGPITGSVDGNTINFRSIGEGFTIDWNGVIQEGRITGQYKIVKRIFSQKGTWWVSK